MSLRSFLEIAKVQNNISVLSDALVEEIESKNLSATTEQVSEKTTKISIDHATSEEVATLVSSFLDVANVDLNLQVHESACGSCAFIILNDEDMSETASLEVAGEILIDTAAKPIEEDEDDEDEGYAADPDADVDDEDAEEVDDEDEVDDSDDGRMHILTSDEAFKLATRLHALACGNNKQDFPLFLSKMDELLRTYRNRSGFEPTAEQATASVEDFMDLAEVVDIVFGGTEMETAKSKKKVKKGRSGFLSAYMKIVGKDSSDLAIAWDHLDIPRMRDLLSECGAKLLTIMEQERIARGLDKKPEDESEEETEETTETVVQE